MNGESIDLISKETINYWELRDALAEETQFYVPKILALAILDKYPDLFGVPQTGKPALVLKQVATRKSTRLFYTRRIAKWLKT